MILSRLHRRAAALVAILAISLQALWPLIAQAQPRVAGELVPVCTVNGITHYVELPASKTPLEERSSSHGDHCKLCVFGSAKAGAILPATFGLSVPEYSFERIESKALWAPYWRPHFSERSRAPPVIS